MTDEGGKGDEDEVDPNLLCEPARKEELENANAVDQIRRGGDPRPRTRGAELDQRPAAPTFRARARGIRALALQRIHPFSGGNGRTSRAIAYLIVCAENGAMLPGDVAMPDLILERRDEYILALQAVDLSALDRPDDPDFGAMTTLLQDVLTPQLASAITRLSKATKSRP